MKIEGAVTALITEYPFKRIALNEGSRMLRYWKDNVNFNSSHSGLNLFNRIAMNKGLDSSKWKTSLVSMVDIQDWTYLSELYLTRVWIQVCPGTRKTTLTSMIYIHKLIEFSELHWTRVWIQGCPGTRKTTLISMVYIQDWPNLSELHWTRVWVQGCLGIRKMLVSAVHIQDWTYSSELH